uniref:Periplasmic binding protein domain-containing protein n=1 Tax=Gracilinema caldarium TaxID=215591 RepID=A0A7C3E536_9SPIR
MKNRVPILIALILVVCVVVPSFASGKADTTPAKKQVTILFMPGVADPFYFTMEKGMKAKAQELGVNLIVAEYPKSWGPEAQVPILEATIQKGGIDGLLIAPTSVDALKAPLKKIYDKGIEIITVDTYIGDGDYSKSGTDYGFPLAYIGSDNELGGKQIAEHMAKMLGEKGKVFVEATNPDVSSVQGRVKGFTAGIAQFPNMKLVGVEWCMDVQQTAMNQTLAALQKDKDIVGIFGVNVFSAQGAAQAVVNAGLSGAVKIALWDATQTNIESLKKGTVDLVLAQKPAEIGSLGVEWMYKYLTQKVQVPKKVIPGFEFFTRENVDDPKMQQFIYQ